MARAFFGWALCSALASTAASAQAPSLRWSAPSECASAAEIQAALAAKTYAYRLEVSAEITRQGSELVLQFSVDGGPARVVRELRAADCHVLSKSVVWLVELAATSPSVDRESPPRVETHRAEVASPPTPPQREARKTERLVLSSDVRKAESTHLESLEGEESEALDEAPVATPDDSSPLRVRGSVGLGAMAIGLGPVAPDLSIDLGLASSALEYELRLGAIFHATEVLAPSAEASFQSLYALASVCTAWEGGRLRAGPCAVVAGFASLASGSGLLGSRQRQAFWGSLGAAARLAWRVHEGFGLTFEAGLMVPVTARPRFEVGGSAVAQGSALLGYGRLGIMAAFL